MPRTKFLLPILKKSFPQRFFFARLTKIPVLGKIIERLFFWGDKIYYLPRNQVIAEIKPKTKTITIQKPFSLPEELVLPTQIVEWFIEQANCHVIMNFCICRVASHCQHYPEEFGCLFLGEAARKIDPRYGRLVPKEEALTHIHKCHDAGLIHLIGRNKLDSVWLNAKPSDKLLTICNCCECCCLWRMIPQLSKKIQRKITRIPGLTVSVDSSKCIGCGNCITESKCFVNARYLVNNKAVISEACRGCGRCITHCKQNAIILSIKDDQFLTKTIEEISSAVTIT